MLGKLIMAIGFLLTGPSYILFMPDNVILTTIGISLLGFSLAFSLCPLFPMMMRTIKMNFIMEDSKGVDLVSGLYTASFGLGTILGPLTGVYLNWLFGFKITTDILANISLLVLAVMLIYYIVSKSLRDKA